jgi:hypothetical protein
MLPNKLVHAVLVIFVSLEENSCCEWKGVYHVFVSVTSVLKHKMKKILIKRSNVKEA